MNGNVRCHGILPGLWYYLLEPHFIPPHYMVEISTERCGSLLNTQYNLNSNTYKGLA